MGFNRKRATRRLRMTVTTAEMDMASAIAATGPLLPSINWKISSQMQKGEPGGSLFCQVAESPRKRAGSTYVSRATRTAKAV